MGFYVLLALVVTAGVQAYTRVLYATEDRFDGARNVPGWLKPAIGGILFALLDLALPATLGRGEDVVHALLAGRLPGQAGSWTALAPALVLLAVAAGKIVSTGLTIGSGGSGPATTGSSCP